MSRRPAKLDRREGGGETHYLWRAVEHKGGMLESYVIKTWDKQAALAFMKKALRHHGQA